MTDARSVIIESLSNEMCGACRAYKEHEGYADHILAALATAGFEIAKASQLEEAVSLLVDSRSIATAWNYESIGPECTMEMASHADDVSAFLRLTWTGGPDQSVTLNDGSKGEESDD
jgi:hypothetical protein